MIESLVGSDLGTYSPALLLPFPVMAHDDNTSTTEERRSVHGDFRRFPPASHGYRGGGLPFDRAGCVRAGGAASPEACVEEGRELKLGFYAQFAPVSHSAASRVPPASTFTRGTKPTC